MTASPIIIRDVTAEDAEPCAAFINDWYDETAWITRGDDETPENILAEFKKAWPRPRVFIAERNGEVLGYLALERKDPKVGGLFIAAAHRRSGIGTALLNHAKALEPEGLTLWTAEANEQARAFYRRHGFDVLMFDSPDKDDHPGGGDFLLKWPGIRSASIETERLILRRPHAGDVEAAIGFSTSERAQFIGRADNRGKAWRLFAMEMGHWDIRGYGMFAVTKKGSDAILGLVGPWFPVDWPEKEIGWMLFEGAEGQGIGYEAAIAIRRYVFRDLGWDTAVSYIDQDNTRSIRLAERLGAVLDTEAARPAPKDLVYRHSRTEGLAA